MKSFLPKILSLLTFTAIAFTGNTTQLHAEIVSYDKPLEFYISQGILPVSIQSNDAAAATLVRYALGVHGAFDTRAGGRAVAVIRIENRGNSFVATSSGTRAAFRGTLSTSSSTEADLLELCDKIIVAVGQTYNWNLRPLFSTTRIAFSATRTGKREIYFSDILFRSIKQATSHNSISIMPRWDPSGTRILYTTYKYSGAADVYSVDINSGAGMKFAAYKNSNNAGGFSPDGSLVALALSAQGPMNVYVKPTRGGNAKAISPDEEVQTSPVFSPDGRTVLFVSGPTGSPRLFTAPANGGRKTQLLRGYSNATEPAWSRAAPEKIAFSWRNSIAIYNLKTGKTTHLGETIPGRKFFKAAWCADGRHIVASEEIGKASRLVIIDTEGGQKPKVTRVSPDSMRDCYDPDTLILR